MRIMCAISLLLSLLLQPSTSLAQSRPTFPNDAHLAVVVLSGRHPELAKGTDAQRRQLTRMIIEQIVCDLPNDGYMWKSSSPTNPPSKDAIARLVQGRLYAWDWQNGTTREPMTYTGKPADHDITGQHPIPLSCFDHVGGTPTPPSDDPSDPPTDETLAALYSEFQAFKLEVLAQWHVIEERDERIFAAESAAHEQLARSLEEHREASRQTRNAVLRWLGNWRNIVAVAGGILGGVLGSQ